MGGLIVVEDSNNHRVSLTPKDGATGDRTVTIPDYPLDKEVDATGFKNKIINGGMDIWQRGISQTAIGYGSVDRWRLQNSVSNVTISREGAEVPSGFLFSMKIVNNSGGDIIIRQFIENGYTILNGKTLTMSAQVKCTSGSIGIDVGDVGYVSTTSTTWTKIATTVTSMGSAYSPHAWVDITVSTGSTVYITGIQLEEGSVATPFEQRPIGLEYNLCLRYYEEYAPATGNSAFGKSVCNKVIANASWFTAATFPFKVRKRTMPTVIFYAHTTSGSVYVANTARAASASDISIDNVGAIYNVSGVSWNSGDELRFGAKIDAEL